MGAGQPTPLEQTTMVAELQTRLLHLAREHPPLTLDMVAAFARERSPTTGRVYGASLTARIWGVHRSTIHRHLHFGEGHGAPAHHHRGRPPLHPDAEVIHAIEHLVGTIGRYVGYREAWRRLHQEGVVASRERVRVLLARIRRPRGR